MPEKSEKVEMNLVNYICDDAILVREGLLD